MRDKGEGSEKGGVRRGADGARKGSNEEGKCGRQRGGQGEGWGGECSFLTANVRPFPVH